MGLKPPTDRRDLLPLIVGGLALAAVAAAGKVWDAMWAALAAVVYLWWRYRRES